MRCIAGLAPWIALAVFAAIFIPLNLKCRVFFPSGSTVRLAFEFGWPVSYLSDTVPGSGLRGGSGPNYVWGHPEFNDDETIMEPIRSSALAGLSTTLWAMSKYGRVRVLGVVVDGALLLSIWPIAWLLSRRAVASHRMAEANGSSR
jgi:hypothetical protein